LLTSSVAVFSVKDLDEGVASFESLPQQARARFVKALTDESLERKPDDAKMLAKLFARLASGTVVSKDVFVEALQPVATQLNDLAIDYPTGESFHAYLVNERHVLTGLCSAYTTIGSLLASAGITKDDVTAWEADEDAEFDSGKLVDALVVS
jgi:hypothetical protein